MYGATIFTYALAIFTVLLRFLSRYLRKAGFLLDDWLVVAALVQVDESTLIMKRADLSRVSATGLLAIMMMCEFPSASSDASQAESCCPDLSLGLGRHIWIVLPEFTEEFFKLLFCRRSVVRGDNLPGQVLDHGLLLQNLWGLVNTIANVHSARCDNVLGICMCESLVKIEYLLRSTADFSEVGVTFAQCRPISGFWNKGMMGVCTVNEYRFFFIGSIPNILTDVALLVLPLPYVWKLHQKTWQKIALGGIFLLGSL